MCLQVQITVMTTGVKGHFLISDKVFVGLQMSLKFVFLPRSHLILALSEA